MGMTLLLLILGMLATAGVAGTLALVARDGYRPVPTRYTQPPRPARAGRVTQVTISARGAQRRDGMPRAGAPPIRSR